MQSEAPINIVIHESKQSLAGSVGVGRKFAANRPYVARAYTNAGKFVGYVNLLTLMQWSR